MINPKLASFTDAELRQELSARYELELQRCVREKHFKKILYSPGYGAGWSSWIAQTPEQIEFCCEYKPFIEYLEKHGKMPKEKTPEFFDLASQFTKDYVTFFPEAKQPYMGGMEDLAIETMAECESYHIEEYDGYESVAHG
jgi:hypothetical protein